MPKLSTIPFIVVFLTAFSLVAQQKDSVDQEEFIVVDEPAVFPGGMSAFYKFIGENMTYPAEARRAGIQGRVYVQFIINKDGFIDQQSVTAVKSPDAILSDEAVRVMQLCPRFEPARHEGKVVRQRMVLPLIFRLTDDTKKSNKKRRWFSD